MVERLRLPAGPQLLWALSLPAALAVAIAGFARLFAQGTSGLLIQGPLVVDPTLANRLASVASPTLLRSGQLAIHVVGLLLFVGLGVVIASRSHSELSFISASMLTVVGVSLFAPLNLLEGGWARAAALIGEAVPDDIANYWFSLAGILLLVFLRLFFVERPRRWEQVTLMIMIGFGLLAFLDPRASVLPANYPDPWGQVIAAGIPLVALGRAWTSSPARPVRPVLTAMTLIAATLGVLLLLRPSLRPDAFGLVLATPRLQALYGLNTLLLATAAVFALPVSIMLAVVRYRLFEIDVLINRALVYGALTAIATLIFVTVSLAMSALAGNLIGAGVAGSRAGQIAAIAGVLTGTALAIGMQPLRKRIQRAIDQRFYREKFDAERALERLVGKLASVVDRAVLEDELRALLNETLQPKSMLLLSADPLSSVADPGGLLVPLGGGEKGGGTIVLGPRRAGIPYRGLELQFLEEVGNRVGPALHIVELFEQQEAARRHRQRVDEELGVAQRIQRELLPRTLPRIEGYDIEVFYQPAREVGGDFYDFYPLPNGHLAFTVGDATDKGMPAALVMASCRTVLRGVTLSESAVSPGDVLARANSLLVGDIPAGMFITCLFGILDASSGELRFANAGHNPPLHWQTDGSKMVKACGMPLGLLPGMDYEERTLLLAPGEVVLLTSDGVTEAHSPERTMFGFDGLLASPATVAGLVAALNSFTGDVEQEDDITVLGIRRFIPA
ncbi:MAG: PP2C family protein-serine/threonine phosphatase [Acidimicrobiia bacterium]|nr:PP2C family protein-serine/threonine phosphatase [Acidimicrobiia bacterium]MDQ3501427.1 PP2C family protein-serine/threonine phosphatase [Actinomycetota bacterium]